MNDKELERLADLIAERVFDKLISKQQEWDEQFNEQMTEVEWNQMEYRKEDFLKSNQKKIEELKELLAKAINEEDYIAASKINSKIVDLKNKK
jgi:protein-arginine kinase activator protein McsA